MGKSIVLFISALMFVISISYVCDASPLAPDSNPYDNYASVSCPIMSTCEIGYSSDSDQMSLTCDKYNSLEITGNPDQVCQCWCAETEVQVNGEELTPLCTCSDVVLGEWAYDFDNF